MTEPVFNLFLYVTGADNVIRGLGAVRHDRGGTDEQKSRFLQLSVADDLPAAVRRPVPIRYCRVDETGRLSRCEVGYPAFLALMEVGQHLLLFEELFQELDAPRNPLVCVTPVVDGEPRVEAFVRF